MVEPADQKDLTPSPSIWNKVPILGCFLARFPAKIRGVIGVLSILVLLSFGVELTGLVIGLNADVDKDYSQSVSFENGRYAYPEISSLHLNADGHSFAPDILASLKKIPEDDPFGNKLRIGVYADNTLCAAGLGEDVIARFFSDGLPDASRFEVVNMSAPRLSLAQIADFLEGTPNAGRAFEAHVICIGVEEFAALLPDSAPMLAPDAEALKWPYFRNILEDRAVSLAQAGSKIGDEELKRLRDSFQKNIKRIQAVLKRDESSAAFVLMPSAISGDDPDPEALAYFGLDQETCAKAHQMIRDLLVGVAAMARYQDHASFSVDVSGLWPEISKGSGGEVARFSPIVGPELPQTHDLLARRIAEGVSRFQPWTFAARASRIAKEAISKK